MKAEQPNHGMDNVTFIINPSLTNDALNTLFAAAWPEYTARDFNPVLSHSLVVVGAYDADRLIGFVNLAWDGGSHAFVLDTTVHPEFRRRGIGQGLIRRAVAEAKGYGVEWVHVDFEPHLQSFYDGCGFASTSAGLLRLSG